MPVLEKRHLEYVEGLIEQKIQPRKFRDIITIDNTPPVWADVVSVSKVEGFAKIEPVGMKDNALHKASLKITSDSSRMYEFGASYEVFDREIARIQQLGINIDATKALVNARAAEGFLDSVAARGFGGYFGQGLANDSNVVATPVGTAWTALTVQQILTDIYKLLDRVTDATHQTYEANTLALPTTAYQHLANTLNANTDVSALTLLQTSRPGVRVVPWVELNTIATGGRAVAFNNSDEVTKMIIAQELTPGQPKRELLGYEIAQTLVTGGVVTRTPNAISYLDGMLP